MEHILTLEVPEELYEPLAKAARKTGRAPEELALEWLSTAICIATEDPVEGFIGAFRTEVSDWADHHDTYIGRASIQQLGGKENAGGQ